VSLEPDDGHGPVTSSQIVWRIRVGCFDPLVNRPGDRSKPFHTESTCF
jgi:hypothetical protein